MEVGAKMFENIYKHLKNNGFNVYSIGQHKGLCNDPYIVIKENTDRLINKSVVSNEVELLLYYPLGSYTSCKEFICNVKKYMKLLKLRDNNIPFPIIVEDEKQAYMTSISYQNNRKKVL